MLLLFLYFSANSSDQNDSESDNGNDERSWQLQKESLERLDRLNMVVNKMQEVREQRQILLSRLREKMNQEDKDAAAAGQDDSDVLGEVRGSKVDVMAVVTKKLNDRYGNLVCISTFYHTTMVINMSHRRRGCLNNILNFHYNNLLNKIYLL